MSGIPERAQLAIVGGGPGGYHAAFKAAALGLEVVLIDPEEKPGGVCLHRGCIPSKALLHVAKLVAEAAESEAIGVSFAQPEIDVARVRAWKDEVVGKLTGALATRADKSGVTHVRGTARLTGANGLRVELVDGGEGDLEFEQAVLATGSRPVLLPDVETGGRIVDSTGALELNEVPKSLLVVGGGYIGLELGSVYHALGSKVTVVEMTGGLLPGCDRDLVSVLKRRLDRKFEAIMLNTKVAELKEQKNGVAVALEGKKKGGTENRRFAQVLIAVGRRPNTDDLGLDAAGIETDERGFVKVDAQRRTSVEHVFAIGDIAGEPMLAHKAYGEADAVAEAAAGRKAVYEPRAVPAVVFTDPEIAWCGLTETEAKAQDIDVKTAKLPWRGNGRALTLGRDDGLTKLIIDPESDRLLGMGLAGPGAGELIAEGVLALEMAAVSEDLRRTIHPHPTLSETVYDVAQSLFE